jgi:hypothetical protein
MFCVKETESVKIQAFPLSAALKTSPTLKFCPTQIFMIFPDVKFPSRTIREQIEMRPLTTSETHALFKKLASFAGSSLNDLIAPLETSPHADRFVFRLHRDRVYYVLLSHANLASSIARDKLLSLGTCIGTLLRSITRRNSRLIVVICRKIQQDRKNTPTYNRFTHSRPTFTIQDMDSPKWSNAAALRRFGGEGACWSLVGGLP